MKLSRRIAYRLDYIRQYSRIRRIYNHAWGLGSSVLADTRKEQPILTALLRVQNEDYWIELIIRTLAKVSEDIQIIVIDSGSTDKTIDILDALRQERIQLEVFRHQENCVSNPLANLILERIAKGPYFFIVDGDDIQLEPSIRKLVTSCRENSTPIRYCMHYRHFAQNDISKVTRRKSASVKYIVGRAFRRDKVRFNRYHPLDSLEVSNKLVNYFNKMIFGQGRLEKDAVFLEDAFVFHAALLRRSSLPEWDGYSSIVRYQELSQEHAKARKQYIGHEKDLINPEILPKELFELKYSNHNEHVARLKSLSGVEYV